MLSTNPIHSINTLYWRSRGFANSVVITYSSNRTAILRTLFLFYYQALLRSIPLASSDTTSSIDSTICSSTRCDVCIVYSNARVLSLENHWCVDLLADFENDIYWLISSSALMHPSQSVVSCRAKVRTHDRYFARYFARKCVPYSRQESVSQRYGRTIVISHVKALLTLAREVCHKDTDVWS